MSFQKAILGSKAVTREGEYSCAYCIGVPSVERKYDIGAEFVACEVRLKMRDEYYRPIMRVMWLP